MKGIGQLMKQAQAMQENMQRIQEELAQEEVEAQAGGGMIRIVGTCKREIRRVEIEPELMSEDKELLEDLIAAALNDLNQKIDETVQARMASVTAGLPLPDGMKLPF
ncbi:MAG: YbaB/EbfC family nucleoid-associated protein [Gammaproteobacteria bacterium]|jgi:DNA-binding YbaB/EbfC family protein